MSLDRAVLVRALYSLPGLSKLCKNEGLNLSDEGNRIVMCHILSKIGVTVGQKIAQRCKHQLLFAVVSARVGHFSPGHPRTFPPVFCIPGHFPPWRCRV